MKILSAEQIRALDKYTIENEPVVSIDLMERAAGAFFEAVCSFIKLNDVVQVVCGMGNNGGDGLVVARRLVEAGYRHVSAYVVKHSPEATPDFTINEERLKNISGIHYIATENQIPKIEQHSIVIDAIFGSGLTRPVKGLCADVIESINQSGAVVYSVDSPSGLFCDKPNSKADVIVQSNCTFTFHAPKLSFLFADNGRYVPQFRVLDIGLMKEYADELSSDYFYLTTDFVRAFFKKREKFSHKGTYGHALICAGSFGKMGAAVLAVRAALKSGAGLVSANIPSEGYEIMQTTNPEAMVVTDPSARFLTKFQEVEKISAIGVGPGIGTEKETEKYLKGLLESDLPMVIDADALNILSANKKMLSAIGDSAILTPHPGEFKRLAGDWKNDLEKFEKQLALSAKLKAIVVLKGAHTSVSTADGKLYFNSSGNAGMAKGGSGDVLTGIITSLLAQHYSAEQAALIGVHVHGLAGDFAKEVLGETSLDAGDIIHYLPKAFQELET